MTATAHKMTNAPDPRRKPTLARTERIFLSPQEAADRLGISLSLLRPQLDSGDLPAVKLGTRTMIPVAGFDTWLSTLPTYPTRAF